MEQRIKTFVVGYRCKTLTLAVCPRRYSVAPGDVFDAGVRVDSGRAYIQDRSPECEAAGGNDRSIGQFHQASTHKEDGEELIILLAGGTKKKQSEDIAEAQALWADYKKRKKEES